MPARLALALATLLTTCARAEPTGPLIAELVEYSDVRQVIPATTAAAFTRTVQATPEQQAAAATLLQGARTELNRVVNRHLRTVRDDPTFSEIQRSEQQVLQDAAAVERQVLADLAAVLTPEQEGRFAAFERAHRRSLLRIAGPQPLPLDLWEFLASVSFDPSSDPNVSALLERFDVDSDAALVRQRRAMLAYFDNVRKGFDGTPESRERDRLAQREFFAANANLTRTHAAIVEPIINALPPAIADRLVLAIITRAIKDFDTNLVDPARFPVVREVLALDLQQQQREEVEVIVARASTDALALVRKGVIEQARFELLDNERRTDGRTSPLNLYLEDASKLRKTTSEAVLALLTPQQRRDYDASDVIDPSSTSTVNDLPPADYVP